MTGRTLPAITALAGAVLLAVLLFVPYVASQYRRRGELGWTHALSSFAFLMATLAILTYTLLPLPEITPDFCSTHGYRPQLRPFQFLTDIRQQRQQLDLHGLSDLWRSQALQVRVLNVALFVPLGMFLRHLFGRGVPTTIAIGFLVSLFVELTQLTGNWFLYPCAYRHFDVDDLMANTAGAALGALLAPLLNVLPAKPATQPAAQPRPVTAFRRLLGMLCDLLIYSLLASALTILLELLQPSTDADMTTADLPYAAASAWLPGLLLFLLVPLIGRGPSLGQRAVLLHPVTPHGHPPPPTRTLIRTCCGLALYSLLDGLGALNLPTDIAANLLALASGIAVLITQDRRGLSCALTGLRMTDRRTSPADNVSHLSAHR
jgi:glycopeptide antibiotics resistance protein